MASTSTDRNIVSRVWRRSICRRRKASRTLRHRRVDEDLATRLGVAQRHQPGRWQLDLARIFEHDTNQVVAPAGDSQRALDGGLQKVGQQKNVTQRRRVTLLR
jgi:hypothetical protein